MAFYSSDTDVIVLVIANYDLMLKNTSISMASGVVRIDPIWSAIGAERAKALPAFHAFTGTDNIGRFSRIGKATGMQVYMKADRNVISSLQMLSTEVEVNDTMLANLASFVCVAYTPPTASASMPSLNCGGIFSASIWQKVTSCLLPLEP